MTTMQPRVFAGPRLEIHDIMDLIPHRFPILMIDRIVEIVPMKSAVGMKCVSIGEPHFQGHFPQQAVMPGVMIIESMAQTAAVMVVHSLGPTARNKIVYFMSIEGAKFRRPVVPGDMLEVHVETLQSRGPVWKLAGRAMVEGKVAAEATISAMIRDPDHG